MICSKGHRRSYCEWGVEICKVCGERVEVKSECIDMPLFATRFIKTPRMYGYSFREIQGYRTYGIMQKY